MSPLASNSATGKLTARLRSASRGISTSTSCTPASRSVASAPSKAGWVSGSRSPVKCLTSPSRTPLSAAGRTASPVPASTRSSSQVGHCLGRRAGRVARVGNRRNPRCGIAPDGGPQRCAAVERARNAHRPACIRSERGEHRAPAKRRAVAGGGTAGHARAVVRVARADIAAALEGVVAADAEGELVHAGLADHHRAGGAQSGDGARVGRGPEVLQRRRVRGARQARDVDVVLDRYWQPFERATACAGLAPRIHGPCCAQSTGIGDRDEGIQRRNRLGLRNRVQGQGSLVSEPEQIWRTASTAVSCSRSAASAAEGKAAASGRPRERPTMPVKVRSRRGCRGDRQSITAIFKGGLLRRWPRARASPAGYELLSRKC